MKVSIFGLGYVGCVTAGCLAKDGHQVVGVDVLAAKVQRLGAGKPTVIEPGLEKLIAEAHRDGLLTTTTHGCAAVLGSEVSIVCVGTPVGTVGNLDLAALRLTIELIGQALRQKAAPHVVVLRSTVPPGTTESVLLPILCSKPNDQTRVVVVPEFLREGCALADYFDPPFVVVGSATGDADQSQKAINELFGKLVPRVQWVPYRQAEMLKGVCNAFHALKVAFANEVGALCGSLGVDGHALMMQFVQDTKLNISPAYLRPGLPFGGSCLPKDVRMLAHLGTRAGIEVPLLENTLTSNEAHLKRTIQTVLAEGRRRIGLDGLAFKPGTDDLRESPIVLIAEHLIGKGYDLKIHDPIIETSMLAGTNREYMEAHLPHLSTRLVHDLDELIEHAEVVLLARDQEPILKRIALKNKQTRLIDLRGENHLAEKLVEIQARIDEPPPGPSAPDRRKTGHSAAQTVLEPLWPNAGATLIASHAA